MKDSALTNKQGLTEKEFLSIYDAGEYERPSVTVDMLVFTVMNEMKESYRKLPEKVLKILMVKRGNHPFMGYWALPGGFVDMNESLDKAALRELKEETNIDDIYMEQLYTWGDVGRDPRTRVIGCSYMSLVDSGKLDIMAGDDAEDAAWFRVKCSIIEQKKTVIGKGCNVQNRVRLVLWNDSEELTATIKVDKTFDGNMVRVGRELIDSKGIAFDHGKIIEYAVERLRNKIEYTDIAFNLMPDRFTLTELQQVYEVILDKKLLKANFRRKISDMVMETDEYSRAAGHRPSKLFRYNPNCVEKHFE
ncbi:MAG: NUDIX domain-containing protein [Clostridiaceae bacterium]|nr:NUDIX domain-containing protein [Clostridiaceae bacterium]